MAISKQQAKQELLRRSQPKSVPVITPQKSVAIKELAKRELTKRGLNQQKPQGFGGLVSNAKTDFTSFGKGMLGIGKKAITHPLDTGGKLAGMGKEIIKGVPGAVGQMAHDVANFGETQRKGIEAFNKLRQIPLDKQKEMLARDIQAIGQSQEAKDNPDKRRLAQMGLGLLGNYSQYSRFGEKVYAEPFSAALDIIPALKGAGGGKLLSKGAGVVNKIPAVANATEKLADAFVPMGKLKRIGYGDVAQSMEKATTKARNAQEGIIKATVKKFDDKFNLSKNERVEFFDAIDAGRRDSSFVPSSKNPKIQGAIDWYMNKELPAIKKVTGITEQRAGVREGVTKQLQDLQLNQVRENIKPVRQLKPKNIVQRIEAITGIKTPKTPKTGFKQGMYVKSLDKNNIGKIKSIDESSGTAKVYFKNNKTGLSATVDVPVAKLTPTTSSRKLAGQALQGKIEETTKILNDYKTNPDGIQNYLHHFFNPTKETNFGGKLSTPSRGFLKQSKDVEGFVKDPVVSIAGVKTKAAVANIKENFTKGVLSKYGRNADEVTEFKGGKIIGSDGEELARYKGGYLPKDLAEEMLKIEAGEPGWLKTVLSPMRTFNANWKPLATAFRPRYHLRNIIGNMYNASFVGGMNPLRVFPAAAQQIALHIGTQIKDGTLAGKLYGAFFKQPPSASMIRHATEDGVIGAGFFGVDINDMADIANTVEDFSKAIAKMENPAMIYRVPILRQWMQGMQKFGTAIEDNARLSLYMDRIAKGASRVEAKAYVNKHLFDYLNGLGQGDKIIKAFIPFWSWKRFNVPLQAGAVLKNPLRHLMVQEGSKPWVQQQEQNNPEYKYLSQREKDMGAVKTGEETNKDGTISDVYMRTQGVLPIQDIGSMFDPDNIGYSPLGGMLNQAYNTVMPPSDPQQNLDYFGRPVEQFPGENKRYGGVPVRGTVKEILNSIPALSELNKLAGGSYDIETRPSGSARLQTAFSPTSSTIQNREKNRQYFESDFNRKFGTGTMSPGYMTEMKSIVKKIIDKPTDPVLNKNLKTIIDLLKQGGFSEYQIQEEIQKALQADLKKDNPKPKRPSSMSPKRPTQLLDPYYANEVKKRAATLNPYFK